MASAEEVVAALPWQRVGECILDKDSNLMRLDSVSLVLALERGEVRCHAGSIYGAFPSLIK